MRDIDAADWLGTWPVDVGGNARQSLRQWEPSGGS